jgi:membrane protein implicated in regulation of membrane protease activity
LLSAALLSPNYTQVALGDAAIVTGLHLGAKLPLSVSFAVAVAANLALVLMLLGLLVVARVLNASSNSRLAAAANSPEVGFVLLLVTEGSSGISARKRPAVLLPGRAAASSDRKSPVLADACQTASSRTA